MCGLLVTGCGGGSDDDDAAASPAASEPAANAATDAGDSDGGPGNLSPNDRMAYMTKLLEIDPSLAANEGTAVGSGQTICEEIAKGASAQRLIESVRARFGDGLDKAKAEQVLGAVRQYVCTS